MLLNVECERCKASYSLDDKKIQNASLRVRCPKCAHVFVVRKKVDNNPVEALPATQQKPIATSTLPAMQAVLAQDDLPAKSTRTVNSQTSSTPDNDLPVRTIKNKTSISQQENSLCNDELTESPPGTLRSISALKITPEETEISATRNGTIHVATQSLNRREQDLPLKQNTYDLPNKKHQKQTDLPSVSSRNNLLPDVPIASSHLPDSVLTSKHLPDIQKQNSLSVELELNATQTNVIFDHSPKKIQSPDSKPSSNQDDAFGELDFGNLFESVGNHDEKKGISSIEHTTFKSTNESSVPSNEEVHHPSVNGIGDDFGELELPAPSSDSTEPKNIQKMFDVSSSTSRGTAKPIATIGTEFQEISPPSSMHNGSGVSPKQEGVEFNELPNTSLETEMANPIKLASNTSKISGASVTQEEQGVESRSYSKKRIVRIVSMGAFLTMTLGGAAFEFTQWGAFGRHWWADRLYASKYASLEREALLRMHEGFGEDSLGRAQSTLQELDRIVAQAPRFGPLRAYVAYANLAYQLRFGKEASRQAKAEEYLSAHVNVTHLYVQLAYATQNLLTGSFENSRKILEKLLLENPNQLDVVFTFAELERLSKRPKEALKLFQKATQIQSNVRNRSGLMHAFEAVSELEQAKKEALTILNISPTHVPSRLALARITYRSESNFEETKKWLNQLQNPDQKSLASAAEQIEIATLRGQVLFATEHISEAKSAFEAAIVATKGVPNPFAEMGLAEIFMIHHQFSDAIAHFRAAALAAPELTQAKIGIARAQLKQEKPTDAKAILVTIQDPSWAGEVGYWLGQAYEKLSPDKPHETIAIYERAIQAQPKDIQPYIALASLQTKLGKVDQANHTLQMAMQAVPPSDKLYRAMSELRFRQGQYPTALEGINRALQLKPNNLEALFTQGRIFLRMGDTFLDQGKQVLERIEATDPKYPGLSLEFGYYYQKKHQLDEALKRYKNALEIAPNDIDVKLEVVRAMIEARERSSETLAREVLDACPTRSTTPELCIRESKYLIGRALLNKGDSSEALAYLKQAAERGENEPNYHLYYAWALLEKDRFEEAEREAMRTIELDQSNGDAQWVRAEIAVKQSKFNEAIALATLALKMNPVRYEAYATLALAHFNLGHEELAIAQWRKAIEGDSNNRKSGFWRIQMADLFYHKGNTASVVNDLKEAIRIGATIVPKPPWLPRGYFLLGDALKRSDQEASKKALRSFLEATVGSTDPDRKEAQSILANLGSPYTGP